MDAFYLSLSHVFQFQSLFLLFCGVAGGIAVGAMPGLSATMAVAVMTSFTFHMSSTHAILLLLGVFFGGIYGGSISSILLRIPGTAAAVMTARDGYPMAKRGEGGQAIGISTWSSFTGGMIGMVLLIIGAQAIAGFALRFSAPETFALAVFGLTIVSGLSENSLSRGLISAAMGIVICMVGTDPITGAQRFTFGTQSLISGLQFVPVMIGLFGISEIMGQLASKTQDFVPQKLTRVFPSWTMIKRLTKTIVRSSLIGVGIGALPGAGCTIAAFVAYDQEQSRSSNPEEYGTGKPEGIAAPEAANNACCGGALMPMLTLGIPGDAVTAILIGAFILHNLQPGPALFIEHPDVIYTIYIGGIVANCFMALIGFCAAGLFARLISFPFYILLPIILLMCAVGSFSVNNNLFDVYVMLAFGLLGFTLNKLEIPLTPMVLGVVLGPILEENLRTSLVMSQGEIAYFLNRPIFLFFMALAILGTAYPAWKRRQKRILSKIKEKSACGMTETEPSQQI